MTRQAALDHHARLQRLFAGAGRMIAGMAGLLGGLTLVIAPAFLRLWTHGEVAFDPWLVGAFVATVMAMAPAQVALMLYQYNNKPGVLVVAQGGYAAGTLILCLLLINGFSAAGAAAGTGLAEFLSIGLLLPIAAAREIAAPLLAYYARSYGAALAAFMLGYAVGQGFDAWLNAQSLLGLAMLAALWSAVVAVPAFFILLDPPERVWIRRYASMVLSSFVLHK
jgi:O-antigen/teichoic acid export membrane protein